MVAQFLSPTRVLVASSTRDDSDAKVLAEAEATLQRAAASLGQKLEFVRVPVRYSPYGGFRSYVNGLQIAGHFVMPEYGGGDAIDRAAKAAFESAMPDVQVLPVNVKLAAASGGAVHCLTLGLDVPPPPPAPPPR
jgi:agmatine/peptidylarginine deiminase